MRPEENDQKQTTEKTTSSKYMVEAKQILDDVKKVTTPNQRQKNNMENSIELFYDDISDISEFEF
jgi:predicted glycosyltransferase